jgi:hypothetical protein
MKRGPGLEEKWSPSSSAVYGCLIGVAVAAYHQVHHAISDDIPDNVYTHMFGELIAAGSGGAILFASVTALRNWLCRTR